MNLSRLTLLAIALSPVALPAQTNPAAEPPAGTTDCGRLPTRTLMSDCITMYSRTRIVPLTYTFQQNDANEILVAARNVFDPSTKMILVSSKNEIVLYSYPEQLDKIEALIHALDKPRKTFRLTYTLAVSDAGKQVGVEHFSILVSDGQSAILKQGDKIPVATGSSSTDNSPAQTQFTYLDVGMNFGSTVTSINGGIVLKSKVEQSSVGPSSTIAGVQEPIVRQTVLDSVTTVPLGKPLMLGSIDLTNSTRHLDIDVLIEEVK